MGIRTYAELEGYYIYRLLNVTRYLNAKAVVWQEVFDNNVPIDKETIVHIWKGGMEQELSQVNEQLRI